MRLVRLSSPSFVDADVAANPPPPPVFDDFDFCGTTGGVTGEVGDLAEAVEDDDDDG